MLLSNTTHLTNKYQHKNQTNETELPYQLDKTISVLRLKCYLTRVNLKKFDAKAGKKAN